MRTTAPEPNDALRAEIYRGEIFQLAPSPAAHALVTDVNALLATTFADIGDPRRAGELPNAELFLRVGRIRAVLYHEARYLDAVRALAASLGFDPARVAFDPPKLRAVVHRGHENPLASAVYAAHRDTWYGNPQGLITCWLALADVPAGETFEFLPTCFDRAVPNDSELFDYDAWAGDPRNLRVGWQDLEAGIRVRYPALAGDAPGPRVGFSCRRGDTLLFSGAHLHQTRAHAAGYTRFSLDFRLVHLDDHAAGRGAQNVDNRSRGSALRDYLGPAR